MGECEGVDGTGVQCKLAQVWDFGIFDRKYRMSLVKWGKEKTKELVTRTSHRKQKTWLDDRH
jgi:hypothetical protein